MLAERMVLDALPLDGLKILILEDEFLIAMDVEQVCRDSGAADVTICRTLDEVGSAPDRAFPYDAVVVDMRLGGTSTLSFARELFEANVAFVFATGYAHPDETAATFPGVPVITKPYNGSDLVNALASVARAQASRITLSR